MGAPELQRRPEIAAVRDLEIAARAAVAGLRHGRHAQPLVGAGPEVWGVRPYRQGDDAAPGRLEAFGAERPLVLA